MKANSGLESRFPLRIDFPDYSASELYEISKQMIAGRGFSLAEGSDKLIEEEIQRLKRHATASSGNGRMVRNFVESVIRRQSSRIATEDISGSELTTILPVDIRAAEAVVEGFDLEAELAKVIGLDSVKKYIRSLNARLKLQAERKKAGLKTDSTQTMHMIFAGNPGTGSRRSRIQGCWAAWPWASDRSCTLRRRPRSVHSWGQPPAPARSADR